MDLVSFMGYYFRLIYFCYFLIFYPYPRTCVLILRREERRERPYGDKARRRPSASQAERPQEKPNLLSPGSQTSSLQNTEKINFYHLSHPVGGILLWQSQQISREGTIFLDIATICGLPKLKPTQQNYSLVFLSLA